MTTTEAEPSELPYPEHPGQTHHEGCYRKRRHHNCAVRRVEELEARVEELEQVSVELVDAINEYARLRDEDEARALTDTEDQP